MTIIASMLWRRLDLPGHDTCSLERNDASWSLRGAAVYRHEDGPAWLSYVVQCDDQWRTRSGQVRGALGNRSIDLVVARRGRSWTLNDSADSRSRPPPRSRSQLHAGDQSAAAAARIYRPPPIGSIAGRMAQCGCRHPDRVTARSTSGAARRRCGTRRGALVTRGCLSLRQTDLFGATRTFGKPNPDRIDQRLVSAGSGHGTRTRLRRFVARRWGNRPGSLLIAEDFGCCASG